MSETKNENQIEFTDKKEILFYYESRQNPNGDPGFENQPRLMPDGTILVTDVRIKRTIRDYAKKKHGLTLFVDFDENGRPTKADDRANTILTKAKAAGDFKKLLTETFDVALFGALVTIRNNEKKQKKSDTKNETKQEEDNDASNDTGDSFKVTGPVQFSLGRSVNQVEIINPTITSHFEGKDTGGKGGAMGKFYSVEYALIKLAGVVNPSNLLEYKNDDIIKKFQENESLLFDCLWNGTNNLVTRSKYPQRSIFFFEVTYDGSLYNDLPLLVKETETMKGKVTALTENALDFSKLIEIMESRKEHIKQIRIAACEELKNSFKDLVGKLRAIPELKEKVVEM